MCKTGLKVIIYSPSDKTIEVLEVVRLWACSSEEIDRPAVQVLHHGPQLKTLSRHVRSDLLHCLCPLHLDLSLFFEWCRAPR